MGNLNHNDPDVKNIRLMGWPDGVNEFYPPGQAPKTALIDAKNVEFREGSSAISRKGQSSEIDRNYRVLSEPVSAMHRYKNSSGAKKRVVVSGETIVADDDDLQYDTLSYVTSKPALQQYNDAMLFGSATDALRSYVDGAPESVIAPSMGGIFYNLSAVESTTGGFLLEAKYAWMATFSVQHGDVFLGETDRGGRWVEPSEGYRVFQYQRRTASWSGGPGTNKLTFIRPSDDAIEAIPAYVSEINFYRSPALTSFSNLWNDFNLYHIGSVNMAKVREMSIGATIFVDDGSISLGPQIRQPPLWEMLKPGRVAYHKGRLFVGSPSVKPNDSTTGQIIPVGSELPYEYHPNRLYWSHIDIDGPEPFVFYPESWLYIGSGESDEIMAMRGFRNQALLVWKPNSFWSVLGGDELVEVGVPDFDVALIDGTVGCTSSDSVQAFEGGMIWRYGSMVYYFDGGIPRPLKSERLKKRLAKIPANRDQFVTSSINPKEREYTLFYTLPGDAGYNRHASVYNFNSDTWTHYSLRRGVGATLTVQEPGSDGYILWGLDDDQGVFVTDHPLIVKSDSTAVEGVPLDPIGNYHKIEAMIQTAFCDNEKPFEDKQWVGIQVHAESQVPIHVDFLVDNKVDTRDDGEGLDVKPAAAEGDFVWGVSEWGSAKWAGELSGSSYRAATALGKTLQGKAMSLHLTWANDAGPVKIHEIDLFYKPIGVR